MNTAAIYHEPLSHHAYAANLDVLVFRIQTAKEDDLDIFFNYGDTAHQGNPVHFQSIKMTKVATTQNHQVYECKINSPDPRLVYYFSIHNGTKIYFYYADHFHSSVSTQRNDFYKFPYHLESQVILIPEWYQRSVVYNIFPDSFTDSREKLNKELSINGLSVKCTHGGRINTILEKLDYIQSLGVNCLYLNPIFMAGEPHKYDTIDYFEIDPCFGTKKDFKKLVEAIHEKKMYIVLDGVFNHVGNQFEPFQEWLKNPSGQYKDWFFALTDEIYYPKNSTKTDVPYACFGYERHMPKINTAHPKVQRFFLDVAKYWMKEFSIDGWRLDVADETHFDFWRKFRNLAKSINSNSVLIAENWQTSKTSLDGSTFDGLMNYDLMNHFLGFFVTEELDAQGFAERLMYQATRYRFMHVTAQLNFLNSHDVPRFFTQLNGHSQKYELALLLLFSFVGVPMIFYGDEIPLEGIDESDYRQPITFNKEAVFQPFIAKLADLRLSHEEWIYGFVKIISAVKGLLIYERSWNNKTSVFLINRDSSASKISCRNEDVILGKGYSNGCLDPYGFAIIQKGDSYGCDN